MSPGHSQLSPVLVLVGWASQTGRYGEIGGNLGWYQTLISQKGRYEAKPCRGIGWLAFRTRAVCKGQEVAARDQAVVLGLLWRRRVEEMKVNLGGTERLAEAKQA